MKAIIITDLDGTLLDHDSYSAAPAAGAVQRVKLAGIPICICSSKTRSEIMHHRRALGILDPFISENGGAVFIPASYFETPAGVRPEAPFEVIELGTPWRTLAAALGEVRQQLQVRLRAFHEFTPEDLARESGLPLHLAAMALDREYDEPFRVEDGGDLERVVAALRERSLQVTRGSRFHHVMGNNDKGKAVDILSERFRRRFPDAVFAGLGDSPNDIPMLRSVDIPILVRGQSGTYDDETRQAVSGLRLADGIGPHGWAAAVNDLLSEWA
jgi:mannosyl-3-phosphoglycerate phosphatase